MSARDEHADRGRGADVGVDVDADANVAASPPADRASAALLGFADRHRRWLPVALAVWFLAFFTGRWRPEPDGAVALTVGRSIARGEGFTHPDGLEAPLSSGLPWVAAWGFGLLGEDSVLLPLLAIAACWALGLGLWFVLVRRVAGRPTAVVMTALLGLSESWMSFALAVRADLPFAAGVVAVLLGWELLRPPTAPLAMRARDTQTPPARTGPGLLCLGAGLGLCALSRSVWVVVAAALGACLLLETARRRRWKTLAGLALAAPVAGAIAWLGSGAVRDDAAVLLGRLARDPGKELSEAFTSRLADLVAESLPEGVFALDVGPIATTTTSALLVCGLALAATRPLRPLWLVLPAVFSAQWLAYGVHDRYALPLVPLLLLAWWTLAVRIESAGFARNTPVLSPLLRWAVVPALVTVVGMNLVDLADRFKEQRSADPVAAMEKGELRPIAEAAAWLRERTSARTAVLAGNDHATTLAFLADRRVLSGRELEKNPGDLPATMLALEPLDARARRAAEATGWSIEEPRWRADSDDDAQLRVMVRR